MRMILMTAAAVLVLGTGVASAATNYVEGTHGFYSYHAPGLGNAANQSGG